LVFSHFTAAIAAPSLVAPLVRSGFEEPMNVFHRWFSPGPTTSAWKTPVNLYFEVFD
jgi:hypothetical protein